jgi:hypothetical protein
VQTGQKVNNQPNVQVSVQNCTTLHYLVVHVAHSMNGHQVNFPMQLTACILEFPRWSYCQNRWLRRSPTATREQLQSVEAFSHFILSFSASCFHLSRRATTFINTPLLHSKWKTLIIEIQNPLFICVLANPWEKSLPLFSCDLLRRNTTAAASTAPNWCSYSLRGFLDWL